MSATAPAIAGNNPQIDQLLVAVGGYMSSTDRLTLAIQDIAALLRAGLPKQAWAEYVTLQNPTYWKAHKRDYLHLRFLSVGALTINADVGLGPPVPFALPAATVTEFFLPENSLLTTTASGTTAVVLAIWDDIT